MDCVPSLNLPNPDITMKHWSLASIPPHDWTLCLDVEGYFDHEHEPERIAEEGFTRPVPVGERDVALTVAFNGDPETPEFHVRAEEDLDSEEVEQANRHLARILGTDLDLRPLYEKAGEDPLLGPILSELYGLKRMSRATLFEDFLIRIVEMRLSHKPTARKMMYRIREAYGSTVMWRGKPLAAWPRPHQLMSADPARIRTLGPTVRKGEYMAGFAADLAGGAIDMEWLDRRASPDEFLEVMQGVRGVGPSASQDLMLYRPRTDATFPSNRQKGAETGLRKWIILSYGGDPDRTTEEEFQTMIAPWKGHEASGIEFLYVNWLMNEKRRRHARKKG